MPQKKEGGLKKRGVDFSNFFVDISWESALIKGLIISG